MNINSRAIRLGGVAILGLVAADAWAYANFSSVRANAASAAIALTQDREVSREIMSIQHQPAIVDERTVESSEVAKRIETAARTSQLPVESVVRVAPEEPKRVGETVYLEKATQITLRKITLGQLFTFLKNATEATSTSGSLQVQSLRLTAPRESDAAGDAWTVDLTLTYRIYSPQNKSARRGA